MISVRNHRPLLSGNKWLLFLVIALLAGACSPRVRPAPEPVKPPVEKPAEQPKPVEKPVKAPTKTSVISMILPFGLDHMNANSFTDATLKQATMALDYYQGF